MNDYPHNVMTVRLVKNQKTGRWFVPRSESAPFGDATTAFEHLETAVAETRRLLDRNREANLRAEGEEDE